MRIFNMIRRKLQERSGFTLSETLVTVLILLMVSAIVAGGVPAAANAYYKVIDAANAQLLLSETVMKLRSELSVATEVENADGSASSGTDKVLITYTSGSNSGGASGWKKQLLSSTDGIKTKPVVKSAGVDEDVPLAQNNPQPLVPGKMSGAVQSGTSLVTSCDSITYTDGVFTITNLKVTKGTSTLAQIGQMKIQNLIPKFSD